MAQVEIEIVGKDKTGTAFKSVENNIRGIGTAASQVGQTVGTNLAAPMRQSLNQVRVDITGMLPALNALSPLFMGFGQVLKTAGRELNGLNDAQKIFLTVAGSMVQAIGPVVNAISLFENQLNILNPLLTRAAANILKVTLAIGAIPAPVWLAIAALVALTAVFVIFHDDIARILESTMTGITDFFTQTWTLFQMNSTKLMMWLTMLAMSLMQKGREVAQGLYNGISSIVGPMMTWWQQSIIARIITSVSDRIKDAISVGAAIVRGVWDGMMSVAGAMLDWVASVVKQIISLWMSAFKIGSPSKVMEDIGKNIMSGLDKGLQTFKPAVSIPGVTPSGGVTAGRSVQPSAPNRTAVVNLTYSPAVSLASQNEVQNVLLPYIRRGVSMVSSGR